MITTFEVASVFKIRDEATAVLTRMAEKVADFNLMVKEARENLAGMGRLRLSGLSARLEGLTDQAAKLKQSFGATFTAMDTGITSAVAEVRLLADEWRAVAGAATAAARATRGVGAAALPGGINPRARIAGPHGGGGGVHVSSLGVPLPGGHASIRAGGNAVMAAAGALAYGMYEEAQFEDAAFRAMYTAGVPSDVGVRSNRMKELRDLVQRETVATGAPIGDVEEAVLTGLRQFAGMPWEDRMKVMPDLLEGAAQEARLKGHGTTVNEAMEVFTGLAHMTKEYSPEAIKKLIPEFAYLSTVDPEKIKQMEKAASYAVPILQSGLDVDPADTLLLTAALQRGGVTNTKSGTWIREMAIRAMPGTSLQSQTAFKKHEAALKAFGLVDDKGNPTWFTDGKPDLIKMLDVTGEHAQSIPLTERAAYERQLFGAQGAGAMAILSDPAVIKQVHVLREEMEKFKPGEAFFAEYRQGSPVQKFRETWADLQKVLMDIGGTALPLVVQGLNVLDGILKEIAPFLPKGDSKTAGGVAAGAIVGGVGGYAVGGLPGAAVGTVVGGAVGGDIASRPGLHGGGFLGALEDAVKLLKLALDKFSAAERPIQLSSTLNVDGRKMAEVVTKYQVQEGAGPAEGAPYHDSTYSTAPIDFALPY